MESQSKEPRWFDLSWIVFWGILSSIWCVSAASKLSGTFDEPVYLRQGLESWRSGSYHALLRVGTMPLPIDVETLPLYIWERWRGAEFDTAADFDRLIPVARATNLVFWWLLLIYGYRLGRLFGGAWAGRLTVLLIACEPNFLAHAALATTDIAVTAFMLGFVYHFWTGRDQRWWRRVGVPSIWYGLAVLAKASAFVFGPLAMVALEMYRRYTAGELALPQTSQPKNGLRFEGSAIARNWRKLYAWIGHTWTVTTEFRRELRQIVFIGFVLVFAYCRTDFKPQKSFVQWSNNLPEGTLRTMMVPVAENLRIFPNAGEGIVYQIKHNIRGHGAFLLGEWDRRAIWYYFPVALVIKLTVPILILTIFFAVFGRRNLNHPIAAITVVLLLFSLNCRVQIGIRLVLPLIAFLITTLAIGLARSIPPNLPAWVPRIATGFIAAFMIVPPLAVWPYGLSYINALWGGPEQGYKLLSDSNYDWGQGLQELDEWREAHRTNNLRIWYFGTDPRMKREPAFVFLQSLPLKSEEDVMAAVRGSYLAVSSSILHNNPELTPSTKITLDLLRKKTPIARTTTFFIYDFTPPRSLAQSP
jgi:hypothetical protein